MELQTKIHLDRQKDHLIDYDSKLLLLGSCFSENIGNKLDYFKFQSLSNPFGILFHPLAIEQLVTNAINQKIYTEKDIFFHNEQWHCFDAHSRLSNPSKEELLKVLNTAIASTAERLSCATHIIITLGTAWVYRNLEKDIVVANCHKVPQKEFLKELLSVEQTVQSLEAVVSLIRLVNRNVSILFTVSPVRHLKDGFIKNQRSKAHLISAVHDMCEPRNNIHYFPSYELMMDELRDYRFYADDMIHPDSKAIHYIWERFKSVWISEKAQPTMDRVETIQKGLAHKPFNPISLDHQKFLSDLGEKQKTLQKEYGHIQFT